MIAMSIRLGPSGPTGPFAKAWRQRPRRPYSPNAPGVGGELHYILAYVFVTGWLVADGSGTWLTLPATWAGWSAWNDSPKTPISYVHRIDVGIKVKFTPLVTAVTDGAQV